MANEFAFGNLVSDFVHAIPPNPIVPQGELVSGFVHETHIPGNPVTPQGQLVSEFVHEIPGNPIEPQGQLVSEYVHELHNPVPTFTDGGWVL
jgi:hypothetical protein